MTDELLIKAVNLSRDVRDCEYYAKHLENIKIGVIPSSWLGSFAESIEEVISLTPEEKETLEALSNAYKDVLVKANERKLGECKKQFEAL